MDKQYNLRSTKRDSIQIPVQVLCSDSDFLSKIGEFSNSKQQVTSSEDSDSELDCSGLMADSDNDAKNSHYTNPQPSTSVDQTSTLGTVDFNAQALVNQEILNQLTKLGNRCFGKRGL